jgi:hypothetical protein
MAPFRSWATAIRTSSRTKSSTLSGWGGRALPGFTESGAASGAFQMILNSVLTQAV